MSPQKRGPSKAGGAPKEISGSRGRAAGHGHEASPARLFKTAEAPRAEEILAALAALGHARSTDSGYASA